VFDCVGGETLEKCLRCVRDRGQIATVGSPPPVWEEARKKG
jgi:NADPH:quinone reductase-like Zn-dependent oxidoreductase